MDPEYRWTIDYKKLADELKSPWFYFLLIALIVWMACGIISFSLWDD